jgi:hypothetical protein
LQYITITIEFDRTGPTSAYATLLNRINSGQATAIGLTSTDAAENGLASDRFLDTGLNKTL